MLESFEEKPYAPEEVNHVLTSSVPSAGLDASSMSNGNLGSAALTTHT